MKTITVLSSSNPMGSVEARVMRKAENYGFARLVKMDREGRHYECPDEFKCTWRYLNGLIDKTMVK